MENIPIDLWEDLNFILESELVSWHWKNKMKKPKKGWET